jgi:uncharacterized protein YbbK (DUF523 family)
MKKILVSACLMGLRCRYDGRDAFDPGIKKIEKKFVLIPVCPEVMGGLIIPRDEATIDGGDGENVWECGVSVMSKKGRSVTDFFKKGAAETLQLARYLNVYDIVLKENSPSCGVFFTNSDFKRIEGMGVTSFLLKKNGFNIDNIESFTRREL